MVSPQTNIVIDSLKDIEAVRLEGFFNSQEKRMAISDLNREKSD
jgi:hypothetical protein